MKKYILTLGGRTFLRWTPAAPGNASLRHARSRSKRMTKDSQKAPPLFAYLIPRSDYKLLKAI